uniref:Reverse transcriptase domain-containing protein n=1 Tax=Tanacetum cinerariifolium TaxID=118510 RepID=A0A699I8D9_TANCI|nr:hypothetical protein [Tanacetum cinerariifolium]
MEVSSKSRINGQIFSNNKASKMSKNQEVKNVVEQPAERGNLTPILSTKEPEHLLSMRYEHLSITPETESDEVTESNAKNLLPIPSEYEFTTMILKTSSTSKLRFSILRLSAENVVYHEEEEVDLEDIFQIQDVVLCEKLLSITRLISNIKSLNDNPTPDCVLNSFKSNNSLLDNFSPEFKTFSDNTEETISGDVCFLEELLIDDSILSHESSDSNFEDNPSIPRPPLEPPDAEFDAGEENQVVMNDKDKFDEDYYFS